MATTQNPRTLSGTPVPNEGTARRTRSRTAHPTRAKYTRNAAVPPENQSSVVILNGDYPLLKPGSVTSPRAKTPSPCAMMYLGRRFTSS